MGPMPPSQMPRLIAANGAILPAFQTEVTAQWRDWKALEEIGVTGIDRVGMSRAIVEADWLPQIRNGREYVTAMREIAFNDPVSFGSLRAIDWLVRQTPWRVEPADDTPEAKEGAEFLEECIKDLSVPWSTVVSEANTCLWAGFSLLEMTFKRRRGFNNKIPWRSSDFEDNKWAFGKFSPRQQHTVWYWIYDEFHNLVGFRQLAPPDWIEHPIPLTKCLHFQPYTQGENPWGNSLLRGSFVPYFFLKRLREIEGIGIERDLAGLPVVEVPLEILMDNATPEQVKTRQLLETFVQNVRRDAREGFLFPKVYKSEESSDLLYEFKLMTSGGSRAINTSEVITRYEQRMATSMLTDFMMLGQGEGAGGSYAMSADKSSLFKTAIEGYLDVIAEEFHRKAIRTLWRLNGLDPAKAPRWVPGSIGKRDLAIFGAYLQALSGTGFPIWPNPELAKYAFEVGDMPELSEDQLEAQEMYSQAQQFTSLGLGPDGQPIEDPMAGQGPPSAGGGEGGPQNEQNGEQPPGGGAPPKGGAAEAPGGVKVKVEVPGQPKAEGAAPKRPPKRPPA